jgi:hypothetical protein
VLGHQRKSPVVGMRRPSFVDGGFRMRGHGI